MTRGNNEDAWSNNDSTADNRSARFERLEH